MAKRHNQILAAVWALGSGSGAALIPIKAQAQSFHDPREMLVPPGDARLTNPNLVCRPEHPHVQDFAARHPLIAGFGHKLGEAANVGHPLSSFYCIPKSAIGPQNQP